MYICYNLSTRTLSLSLTLEQLRSVSLRNRTLLSIIIALNISKLKFCSSTSKYYKAVLSMIIKDVSSVPDCKFNLHCITGKLYLVTIVIMYAFPVWSRTIFKIFMLSSVILCIKLFAAATRWLYQNLGRVYTEA